MTDVTGIELGPDCCVLVRAGSDPSRTTVTAAHAVTPGEWSDDHDALVGLLRSVRRSNRLSPHARVVAWGLPESGASADLAHLPELGPLVAAGFEIDSIVSPVRALADLVRARRSVTNISESGRGASADRSREASDGIAALSLNTHGVAIAIVARGEVVASRVFDWPLGRPFGGAHSEELERYLVVSQIAPELRHLIDLVRPVHGATVTSVITCGNLPDLRSLSMLLIEEMDLEVETLDSVELLDSHDGDLADLVPTLQLAALAASPREGAAHAVATARPRSGSGLATFASLAAMVLLSTWTALAVSGSSPAAPLFPSGIAIASVERPAGPDIGVEGTIGRVAAGSSDVRGLGSSEVPDVGSSEVRGIGSSHRPRVEAQNAHGARGSELQTPRASEPQASAAQPPALPILHGILINGAHRIAILDNKIVNVGDRIGSLVVVRIERDGVTLRDPGGGGEIRLAIRMRKPRPAAT
jgi:hypothetical protein